MHRKSRSTYVCIFPIAFSCLLTDAFDLVYTCRVLYFPGCMRYIICAVRQRVMCVVTSVQQWRFLPQDSKT